VLPLPASFSETADGHRHHLPWRDLDLAVLCVPGQGLPMDQIIFRFICIEDREFPFEQCLLCWTHSGIVKCEVQIVNWQRRNVLEGDPNSGPATVLTFAVSGELWERTHLSPLYNITALWVKEVLRILKRGSSGATLKSMYRIDLPGFFEGGPTTLDRFSVGLSHGWAANPEYFVRPYSQAIAVLRFMSLSSSSSVDRGRPNSRDRPFGA